MNVSYEMRLNNNIIVLYLYCCMFVYFVIFRFTYVGGFGSDSISY